MSTKAHPSNESGDKSVNIDGFESRFIPTVHMNSCKVKTRILYQSTLQRQNGNICFFAVGSKSFTFDNVQVNKNNCFDYHILYFNILCMVAAL